jgi:hypothetical protein
MLHATHVDSRAACEHNFGNVAHRFERASYLTGCAARSAFGPRPAVPQPNWILEQRHRPANAVYGAAYNTVCLDMVDDSIAPVRQKNLIGVELLNYFDNLITCGITVARQPMIFKIEKSIIHVRPKLAPCLLRLSAANSHEFILGDQRPVRRPAIRHDDDLDTRAGLSLQSYNASTTEDFIVWVGREHKRPAIA